MWRMWGGRCCILHFLRAGLGHSESDGVFVYLISYEGYIYVYYLPRDIMSFEV
jgi:hypothetical protein